MQETSRRGRGGDHQRRLGGGEKRVTRGRKLENKKSDGAAGKERGCLPRLMYTGFMIKQENSSSTSSWSLSRGSEIAACEYLYMPTFFLPKAKRPSKIDFLVWNPSRVKTRLKKKAQRGTAIEDERKKKRNKAQLSVSVEVFDKDGEKL